MLKAGGPEGDDPLVDRDAFARSLGELRQGLPGPGDVFATLQRVVDATLAVFQVDGAGLALEHEDGSLRWVVVTDGAAGLLEDTQRDLGEGPGLAAYGDAVAVVVVDLATDRRFDKLEAVVELLPDRLQDLDRFRHDLQADVIAQQYSYL